MNHLRILLTCFVVSVLQIGFVIAAELVQAPGGGLSEDAKTFVEGKDRRLEFIILELKRKYPAQAGEYDKWLKELAALKAAAVGKKDADVREKYMELRRTVMLGNPLLHSKDLLFIKRDVNPPNEKQGNHMCDQYFGFNAQTNGAGLFILKDAFSKSPTVVNLLENAVCENGRYQGKKLAGGAVLSPDLSYDGKTVLFAFTEAEKDPVNRYKWNERSTWHIFKINIDGTGLTQLTDGAFNDFDPCWTPSGRIVFISERRGGFVRCGYFKPADFGRCHGRPVPTFTLHSMNADGSGLVCLSWHETNEWHPSINNDGMVVYTRWDYVDRGFNQAHHPWLTTPDGRNPRAIQGNYRLSESAAPCMEMDVRAIPGSRKYVATAAAHHGQAYGSLVMLDPGKADDRRMASLKSLTPDARFPESTCSNNEDWKYSSAWPLDEEWYLCVYDPAGHAHRGPANNFRIILLHAPTGMKQEIWGDPAHSCLSPIPLCARAVPPVLPEASEVFADPAKRSKTATVGIVNIYESHMPFAKDVKIKELRLMQLLPKTQPNANEPRIGQGTQKSARAVLGSVPVEEDGSVYFEVPACMPFYMQAVDDKGLVYQSMRSDTYAQPGEKLMCAGCHEAQMKVPDSQRSGIAFRRAPSHIKPEVAGSKPFSYPILVQPVLDRNCVECHAKNADKKAPDLAKGDYAKNPNYWYTSYINLRNYVFFFGIDARWETQTMTTPGQFGARVSKLYQMLEKGHHEVKLSADDMHRLSLWMDSNSDFFGSYDNTKEQADGKVVQPALE